MYNPWRVFTHVLCVYAVYRMRESEWLDPLQLAIERRSEGLQFVNAPLVLDYVYLTFFNTLPNWLSHNPYHYYIQEGFYKYFPIKAGCQFWPWVLRCVAWGSSTFTVSSRAFNFSSIPHPEANAALLMSIDDSRLLRLYLPSTAPPNGPGGYHSFHPPWSSSWPGFCRGGTRMPGWSLLGSRLSSLTAQCCLDYSSTWRVPSANRMLFSRSPP